MKTLLSKEGPEVSRIALGMMRLRDWDLSAVETLAMIEEAVALGVTTFDHADIYGGRTCEELFGRAVSLSPSVREQMELVTKCGIMLASKDGVSGSIKHYDTTKAHIIKSVENSLRNLRTDRIDILLIHRPDPLMDPEELGEAFIELKESGKVLHFGVSNFNPGQYDMLSRKTGLDLVTNQIECSVLHLEPFTDGTIDDCVKHGFSPMAWSPMGGGDLFTSNTERAARVRAALESVRKEYVAETIDIMALAWLLRHPAGIVPVIGTGKIGRIRDAVKATKIEFGRKDWFRVWTASSGKDVP